MARVGLLALVLVVLWCVLFIVALFVPGQNQAKATARGIGPLAGLFPTPTPLPTPTPGPTATPRPTPTPVPTPTPAPCSTSDGRTVYDVLKQYGAERDDGAKLARSTPRIQLAAQVATLQRIRRDVQAQPWPACAQAAQTLLVSAMNDTIDGLTAFLGDSSIVGQASATVALGRADQKMADFRTELERVTR